MSRLSRFALVFLMMLWPALGWAQTAQENARGVGVVTTLAGRATVARAALAEPQPLRFKDDVFTRDRIATAEKSIVRVLLGGKALVTVRELSALTITEEAGRSTVDLRSGKIALGVVRQRMRPGEVIEIRTPNAIAAIRGTVLVVELIPESGGGSGGAPRYTTKVHVLRGLVEVSDPNNPGAAPAQVGALESWSRTGSDPFSMAPLTPGAAEQIFADLRSAPQIAEWPQEFMASLTTREQAKAVAVAEFLAPDVTGAGGGGDSGGAAAPSSAASNGTSTVTTAPVSPDVSTAASRRPVASSGPPTGGPPTGEPPTGQALFGYNGQSFTVGGSLYALTGSQTDAPAVPILEATNSSLSVGQNLIDATGNSTFASTGTTPLLYLDPSTLSANRVLSLADGARFTLVSSLLQDRSGRLDLTSDMLSLSGAASLAGSGAGALVDLVGSSATTAGSLLAMGG
ncbi:MAG: FecR domain-containing protein, partial [Gemmatimonadales bacterium]